MFTNNTNIKKNSDTLKNATFTEQQKRNNIALAYPSPQKNNSATNSLGVSGCESNHLEEDTDDDEGDDGMCCRPVSFPH